MTDEAPATHQTGQSPEPPADRSIGSGVVPDAIRGRLIAKVVVAIFAILLLIAAISTFFYFGISDQLSGQVDDQVEQTTELHASVLDNWIADRERELEELEEADVLLSRDSDDVSSYLQRELSSTGFSTLHVVDSETGEVIGSSNEAAVGENMFNYLDEETTSQTSFVSQKQYSSIDGGDEQMVAIGKSHRYHQANRLIVGEVEAETAGPELPQAIDGAETAVVTETGGLVVGSEGVSATVIDSSVDGVGITHGSDHIYSYSALETADLYVVTTTPRDAAFAVADNVLWSFAATIVLTGAVLTAIGVAGGRSVSRELNRLGRRARTMEEGDLSVDLRTGRIDEIGSLYESFAAMRDSLRQQIDEAQSAREEAEAERERVQRINDDLETAADEYCTVMEAAADGDLQVRADVETDNDSMRTIGEEFNEMLDTMEATVGELQTFATQVAIASEQVTASSEEVRSASEQISESVQEISVGAERQNESLQEANGEMSDLSTTTEEIAASSNEVADIAARTATAGRTGREAAQEAIDHVTATESEAEQAVEEIRDLEAEVAQIDELIDRIQQISEQTNMLALNANIEASRSANAEDDGFGAVAQEIKELSNDAKTAAEQVETRLESIREQTVRSAEEVESTSAQLQSAGEQVERAVEALEEIAEYAEETNVGVQEISAATEEQAATTQEVVAIVDEAATISEETTAEAESVAAATEEQTTALTEVSTSASQLSSQASELSNALDHFETDVDDTSAGIVSVEYDGRGDDGGEDSGRDESLERDESAERANGEAATTDAGETAYVADERGITESVGDDATSTTDETDDDSLEFEFDDPADADADDS